jgi:hypothetical protein
MEAGAVKMMLGVVLSAVLLTGVFIRGAASPDTALAEGGLGFSLTTAALVSSVVPAPNSASGGAEDPIVLTLSEALDASSFNAESFSVFGRWSGVASGRVTLEAGGTRIRFEPDQAFHAGEAVTASLNRDVRTAAGESLPTGYTWTFWIQSGPGSLDMVELGSVTTLQEGEEHTQPYGGYAGDFNSDGYPDIAIPNEVSGDVRVMMNDGAGNYSDFTVLDIPSGTYPSPNEGADFNGDGITDFAVGNAGNDVVAVFMGRGDGGFHVASSYHAGTNVRGLCIMDLNLDGSPDIATANMTGGVEPNRGTISMMINDGAGNFTDITTIPSPGRGEKTCATGDANEDGILDLFVGAFNSDEMLVYLGDGNGGLEFKSKVPTRGRTWMIVSGDMNGDGHVDLISANRQTSSAAVFFGDGEGNLSEPVQYKIGEDPLAIDVGDIDGDGDLDVVSSDKAGDSFTIYENAGDGTLIRPRTLLSGKAGSCAIIHDRDRDGDLDITGVDETADLIFLFENPGPG